MEDQQNNEDECQCCRQPIPSTCTHVCPKCADVLIEGEVAERIRSEDDLSK